MDLPKLSPYLMTFGLLLQKLATFYPHHVVTQVSSPSHALAKDSFCECFPAGHSCHISQKVVLIQTSSHNSKKTRKRTNF